MSFLTNINKVPILKNNYGYIFAIKIHMITIQEINGLIDFNMDSIKKLNQELKERVITKKQTQINVQQTF